MTESLESHKNTASVPTSAEVWHAFRSDLYAFIQRRVPSHADAEDVLQEIFLRVHESVSGLEEARSVQAWVYGIARHVIADFYRLRERRLSTDGRPDLSEVPSDERGGVASSENLSSYEGAHDVHEEVISWLRPMIDTLPEKYRVPLRMADLEGLTQQEVADRLDLSLSGAKSRVQRARRKLGERLAACCEVEFGPEGRAVAFRRLRANEAASDECGCE